MTKQQDPKDLQDLLVNADRYLDHVIKFFKGVQEQVEKTAAATSTNVDSTWAAATDDVKSEPAEPEPQTEDVFDLYIEQLERRAYEHSKRGEINATAAIRRIINELRALDSLDEKP